MSDGDSNKTEPWFPGFEGDDEVKPEASQPAPVAAQPEAPVPGKRTALTSTTNHGSAGSNVDHGTGAPQESTEPVVVLWYQKPLLRAGIIAAVGLLAVLIVWALRVDVSLREPVLSEVDSQPRISGTVSGTIELDGVFSMVAETQFSVCGRVAAVGSGPGSTQLVALALGATARDEKPEVSKIGSSFAINNGIVLACSGDALPQLKVGQLCSLRGVLGKLMKNGHLATESDGLLVVHVEAIRTQSP